MSQTPSRPASGPSIVARRRPRTLAGRYRHLLLWTDRPTAEAEAAAAACVEMPDVEAGLVRLFPTLGLAYAVVAIERDGGTVTLAAGHKNLFPLYFAHRADGLAIRDTLPWAASDERLHYLNQDGFADFIARTIVSGPYELSVHPVTLDRRWQALPPGQRLALGRDGRVLESGIADRVFEGIHDALPPVAQAVDELRAALDQHLLRLAEHGFVASEFSGGIDSSIVRARCLARIAPHYRGGVSCRFPYLEFTREGAMQDAVLAHAPGAVAIIPHHGFLPFAAMADVPWHDAPTLASTAWGAFSTAASAARRAGAHILLNGHGGDTLFRWHPCQAIQYGLPADLAGWLTPRMLRQVEERAQAIAAGLNAAPGEGCGGLWHPGMFDPCHPTAMVRAGVAGMDYTSGLASREVLRAAARLWLANPPRDVSVQKPFAHAAFGADLPDALWRRPGKVDHLGIVYRGAIAARHDILRLTRRSADLLDTLDLRRGICQRTAEAATSGIDAGNPMLSILLAVLRWADQARPPARSGVPTRIDNDFYTATFEADGGDDARTVSRTSLFHSTIED